MRKRNIISLLLFLKNVKTLICLHLVLFCPLQVIKKLNHLGRGFGFLLSSTVKIPLQKIDHRNQRIVKIRVENCMHFEKIVNCLWKCEVRRNLEHINKKENDIFIFENKNVYYKLCLHQSNDFR